MCLNNWEKVSVCILQNGCCLPSGLVVWLSQFDISENHHSPPSLPPSLPYFLKRFKTFKIWDFTSRHFQGTDWTFRMLFFGENPCCKLGLCQQVSSVLGCSFGLFPLSQDACSSLDLRHWLLCVLSPPPDHSRLGCEVQEQRFMSLGNQSLSTQKNDLNMEISPPSHLCTWSSHNKQGCKQWQLCRLHSAHRCRQLFRFILTKGWI